MSQHSHIQIPFNTLIHDILSFIVEREKKNVFSKCDCLCGGKATQFQRHWAFGSDAARQGYH